MANKEIADLTGATTPLSGQETAHIVQSGNSRKVALSKLATGLKTEFTDDANAHTAVAGDNGTVRRFTATATLSLTAAATLGNGWCMSVVADGGDVTIDPNGSETVDGQTTLLLADGRSCKLHCDGSRFFLFGLGRAGTPDAAIQDEQAGDGGSSTAGSWVTRTLNTVDYDPASLVTLSSNQVTFSAGGWVEWSAPCFRSNTHMTRLYNVTDSAVAGYGEVARSATIDDTVTHSRGGCPVVASKAYRIEHRVVTSRSIDGFGSGAGFGVNIYTRIRFWRA